MRNTQCHFLTNQGQRKAGKAWTKNSVTLAQVFLQKGSKLGIYWACYCVCSQMAAGKVAGCFSQGPLWMACVQGYIHVCLCVCIRVRACVCLYIHACMWRSEDNSSSRFSLLKLWVPGIELMSQGLAAGDATCQGVLPARDSDVCSW